MIPEIEVTCRGERLFINSVTVEQYKKYISLMEKNDTEKFSGVMFFNKKIMQEMFGNELSLAAVGEIDAVEFLTAIKTVHFIMQNIVAEKMLNIVEVEQVEKEASAFDDYDRENGYEDEDEQPEENQWKVCGEIVDRVVKIAIRLLKNSYSQCMKENIVTLLDYLKFELDITDIEVLGLYSLYADAKIQVTAEEITSEVNKKVNSDDFGTLITQNAYNVRIAFNKGSSYMQFDSTAITMYTGTITDNQKRTRFDYNGTHFYRDGYYVGKIGTNTMKDNDSQRGLVFDIEYNTAYMSWSNKESQNADVYTMKWSYCTQQCGNYEANMLHAGADINMHFFTLRNVSFEDGSISGTLTFKQPLEVGSDGKLAKWSTATLEFKRGILVSGTWSNG